MDDYINQLNDVFENVNQQLAAAHVEEEEENGEYDFIGYNSVLNNNGENGIKTLTGFTIQQFEAIYEDCRPSLEARGRGRRSRLTNKDRLFYALVYMHTNDPWIKLSTVFHISPNYLNKVVVQTAMTIANPLIQRYAPMRKDIPPEAIRFHNFPDAIGAVDTTLLPIAKPSNEIGRRGYYSKKHNQHGCKLQVCVTAFGQCIHWHYENWGSKHDITIFRESGAIPFFSRIQQIGQMLVATYFPLLFDKGYTGINRDLPQAIIVQKRPRGRQYNEQEIQFNQRVEADRVIVENYFSRLKSKFLIFYYPYRGDIEMHIVYAKIGIALTNKDILDNPLRA